MQGNVDAGLHKIDYIVQAMTSSIANHGHLSSTDAGPASDTSSSASKTFSTTIFSSFALVQRIRPKRMAAPLATLRLQQSIICIETVCLSSAD